MTCHLIIIYNMQFRHLHLQISMWMWKVQPYYGSTGLLQLTLMWMASSATTPFRCRRNTLGRIGPFIQLEMSCGSDLCIHTTDTVVLLWLELLGMVLTLL